MSARPIAWTIAGSDSGGGAGIQADLHTFQAIGVHGCSVITAVTAQNSVGVRDIAYLPATHVAAQIAALHDDLPACVIKIGMLGNASAISAIVDYLQSFKGTVIVDPVMVSTSGSVLLPDDIKQLMIQRLFPRAGLLTPNLFEAEKITESSIRTPQDMEKAAQQILLLGPRRVLLKGGHRIDNDCNDYWTDGRESFWLNQVRLPHANTHGSGCTLSAAIAAYLAQGYAWRDALVMSKIYVTQCIRHAKPLGRGPGPVTPGPWPLHSPDLPTATIMPLMNVSTQNIFPSCGKTPLGLYPIIDSSDWIEKLLPLGITTIQLRIKNKTGKALEKEIQRAVQLAEHHQARLFINDYWELAIRYGAYGVHLGQEDLAHANINAIHRAGLRLGISTHSPYEIARARALCPSYIAFGPIFPTTSKAMSFPPQGLERLQYWQRCLDYPVVAIGGIGLSEFDAVLATGVSGIAMISAITLAPDPIQTVDKLLNKGQQWRVHRETLHQ